MAWVKLDDQFHSHPKVRNAGNAGAGVYARALSWCGAYHTDGFISRRDAALIGRTSELAKVTCAELWEAVEPGDSRTVTGRRDSGNRPLPDVTLVFSTYGFFIPDFLHSNHTKAEVEAARSKRRAAGAKGGTASTTEADAQANAQADAQANAFSDAKQIPQHNPAQPSPAHVSEKPVLSVKDWGAAAETLAASVQGADAKTARTFAKQLRELDRLDVAYVLRLADECRAAGDKGAGWALNALRREQARRIMAGLSLRTIDVGAA